MADKKEMTADEKLNLILAEMAALKKKDAEKDEKISMLMEVADNARKQNWDDKHKKGIVSITKLTVHKPTGKIVVGWETVMDEVFKNSDSTGTWTEKQLHKYILEDGETVVCSLAEKFRNFGFITAEVLSKRAESENIETGEKVEFFKVKTQEGKELEINVKFVN